MKPRVATLLAVLLALLLSACHRSARRPLGQPITEIPPVTVGEPVKAPLLSAPYRSEELGVRLELPGDWQEGIAPAIAGPGAKLLHKSGADEPTIVLHGIAARSYQAFRERNLKAGQEPLDAIADQMRRQLVGSAPAGASEPQGKLVSDTPWTLASLARGKVQRFQAQDPKPGGQAAESLVDIYVAEGRGGSLYVFGAVASQVAGLDEARKILDTVVVTGVKDAGAEDPLPPVPGADGKTTH